MALEKKTKAAVLSEKNRRKPQAARQSKNRGTGKG